MDSASFHAQAWKHAFEFDKIRFQIGKGGDQPMLHFLSEEEVRAKGKTIEEYRGKFFKTNFLPRVKAFPEVRDLFVRMLDNGWKLALVSSAKQDELQSYKGSPESLI